MTRSTVYLDGMKHTSEGRHHLLPFRRYFFPTKASHSLSLISTMVHPGQARAAVPVLVAHQRTISQVSLIPQCLSLRPPPYLGRWHPLVTLECRRWYRTIPTNRYLQLPRRSRPRPPPHLHLHRVLL